jgi:DNA-binding CsgD family transcriptional regulator
MPRRYKPGLPPLAGPPANRGPQVTELRSQEELAGALPLPTVELKPAGPPTQIIDLYPNPLPPPGPPVTRESTLADLLTGFASLTDDEVEVARAWLVGESLEDTCRILERSEKAVRELWQSMRRKLRFALSDDAARVAESPRTAPSEPRTNTEPA